MALSAQAAPISFVSTQTVNTFLSTGTKSSGAFDVSSILRSGYVYTGLTGKIDFVFVDDGDSALLNTTNGSYASTGYNDVWTGSNTSYYYSYKYYYDRNNYFDRVVTKNYTDAAESASVSAEGITGTSSSNNYSKGEWGAVNQQTSRTYTHTTTQSWWWGGGYDYNYYANYTVNRNDNYSNTTGFGGVNSIFNLSLVLDQATLSGLLDKSFDYTVTSSVGDFSLQSATLTFTGDEALAVPEPGMLALLGIGVLGFSMTRRQRTKDQQPT